MEDRRELIEKKYGFQVKNQYRARGAILFDTKDGPLLLREKMKLTGHFEWENEVKDHLRKNGIQGRRAQAKALYQKFLQKTAQR